MWLLGCYEWLLGVRLLFEVVSVMVWSLDFTSLVGLFFICFIMKNESLIMQESNFISCDAPNYYIYFFTETPFIFLFNCKSTQLPS